MILAVPSVGSVLSRLSAIPHFSLQVPVDMTPSCASGTVEPRGTEPRKWPVGDRRLVQLLVVAAVLDRSFQRAASEEGLVSAAEQTEH